MNKNSASLIFKLILSVIILTSFFVFRPALAISITERVSGYILLQVEEHGEAYYVHPETGEPHYMADGDAAYSLMRFYSLGITNADLELIPEQEFIPIY